MVDEHRVQYLYTATELTTAGLQPGDITALSLYVAASSGNIENMRIRMAQTPLATLTKMVETGFKTVYQGNFSGTLGKNRIQALEALTWDGVSNVVVEFSRQESVLSGNLEVATDNAAITGFKKQAVIIIIRLMTTTL